MQKRKTIRFQHILWLAVAFSFLNLPCASAKDFTWEDSDGDLSINLILTDNGRKLFNTWNKPATQQFQITSLNTVPRNKFLTAIVMFSGCKPDKFGNCNATVDYITYDPSNKLYGELKNGELWKSKPAPSEGMSQLGVDYLGIVIEPQDMLGQYKLSAIVTDHIAEKKLEVFRLFTVE